MELHLIRHGQTNWNEERRVQGQSESQLTELGIQQARQVGEKIRDLKFDKIFCSSSLRTKQTAEHAFAHLDQAITYLDSLREIFLGPWEGKLYNDIEKEQPDSYRHFWEEPHLFAVEGAETFFQMQKRGMDAISEIGKQSPQQRVAVISHGAIIKSILAHIEELPMHKLWTPPLMHNCAHNIVQMQADGSFRITLYADQPFESVRG